MPSESAWLADQLHEGGQGRKEGATESRGVLTPGAGAQQPVSVRADLLGHMA